ncbi:Uncharacterised protein [Weeksella virosa]|uniref:hypothetical protein n=1 Tax=Weeksella virosa TaxID=1014 RepID=UPI000F71A898|nr:hypothetical protein [Weeksella virosa]VEH63180.1 Uncharacterised protein [Weeksella virosa]
MTRIQIKNIFFILFLSSSVSWANHLERSSVENFSPPEEDCDACGCTTSAMSNGIESLMTNKFIGVRYLYQHYRAQEDAFSKELSQKQNFQTTLLWMRYPISDRIEVAAALPYHFHEKKGKITIK